MVTTTDEETYSTVEVCRLTGATYRQLDYWCRTGRIAGQPVGSSIGSGNRRRWTQAQIAEASLLYVASRYVNARLDEAVEILREVRDAG